jgi:hypothetical protein
LFGRGKSEVQADAERLDAFARAFPADPGSVGPAPDWNEKRTKDLLGLEMPTFTAFVARYARSSVASGLLRFFLPQTDPSLIGWNARDGWHSDWPSVQPAIAFASDWMGRLFLLLPKSRRRDGEPSVGILTTSTGELIVLEDSFATLLGEFLPSEWAEALELDRAKEWQAAGNALPDFAHCVAPKTPLILGGAEEIVDLETTFLVVAVSFGGQIWEQVKDLPEGTKITGVSLQ